MLAILDEENAYPELAEALRPRAVRVMEALGLDDLEVTLVLCDDATIQQLNQQWRSLDKPTDVLSFPMDPELLQERDRGFAPPSPAEATGAWEAEEAEETEEGASLEESEVAEVAEVAEGAEEEPLDLGAFSEPPPVIWGGDVEEGYMEPGEMFPRILGDVVISVDTCRRQAIEWNHSPLDEATRLWIHGLLHLCGYDHQTPEEAAAMRAKEEELLSLFGEPGTIAPLVHPDME